MNRVEALYQERERPAAFARGYFSYIAEILGQMSETAVAAFIEAILAARERGAQIYFIGNGGSAATASHFANDIAIGCRSWDKPFRAMSLTDNVPVMTAIANDYGYDHVFTLQLKALMRSGDVVVAISASGNSPNVVSAVEWAKAHGATTVSLTGFDGGKLRQITDINVHVPTAKGEYGPVEDIHMVLDHLIGAYLMQACRDAVPEKA